jgi:hypothetical protein
MFFRYFKFSRADANKGRGIRMEVPRNTQSPEKGETLLWSTNESSDTIRGAGVSFRQINTFNTILFLLNLLIINKL